MKIKDLQMLCRAYKKDANVRETIDSFDPNMRLDEFEFSEEPIDPSYSGRMPHYRVVMENEIERLNEVVMESSAQIKYLAGLLERDRNGERSNNADIVSIDGYKICS